MWHAPVISASEMLRQEDHCKFETSLDYRMRCCLKERKREEGRERERESEREKKWGGGYLRFPSS